MINQLYRAAAKLLGRPLNLDNFRQGAICLCPAEVQPVPPAIYLEAHLSRVMGAHHMSSIAYEQECLNQKTTQHGATMLYPIGETRLFRGGLWTARREVMTRYLKPKDEIFSIELESAVLTDSDIANQYFGHWLSDAVPASLVGNADMPSLAFRKPHYPHAVAYEELFGLDMLYGNCGKINNLFLLDDSSQNSYKVKRYLELRQRVQKKLELISDYAYSGVYLARGNTGVKRSLINELEVIEHLQKRGFDVVYPEQMSVPDLMRRLWNAPLVISVEGSALNHNIYSIALNGAYLILQPPHLVNHIHKGICDAMNRPYGFYICYPTQNLNEFYVDSLSDLDKVIDGLHNETVKRNVKN